MPLACSSSQSIIANPTMKERMHSIVTSKFELLVMMCLYTLAIPTGSCVQALTILRHHAFRRSA